MTDTPDTITREEADARVAAALREAAERMDNGFSYNAGNRVRALIPDAGKALDRAIAEAVSLSEAMLAALDEAEAERHRWRQAASLGSLHTQADLDRAVAKAHAEAYLSGWVNGSNGVEPPDFGNPVFEKAPGD